MLLGGSALALDGQLAGHTRLRCGTVCVHTLEHTQTCALSLAQTRIQMDTHSHLQPLVYTYTHACSHGRAQSSALRAQGCPPPRVLPTPRSPTQACPGWVHTRVVQICSGIPVVPLVDIPQYPQGQLLPREKSQNPIAGDRNYCSDTELSLAGPRWTLGEGEKMRSALRGGRQEPRADKDRRQT